MAKGKAGRPRKAGPGRPRKEIDVLALERLVAEGLPLPRIANVFGVSEDTLLRNYASIVRPLVRKNAGRPPKELSEKKVRRLIDLGLSAEEIGSMLDVSGDIIYRHFADQLRAGSQKRNARLKSELFRRAMNGSDPLLMFCCKVWCGMSERPANGENVEPRNWFFETIAATRQLLATQKQAAVLNSSGPEPAPPALSFAGITFEPSDADLDVADAESEPVPTPQDPLNGEQLPVAD